MQIQFVNHCGADSSFAIEWDGGESGRTAVILQGQSAVIDTGSLNIPDGTSCWARAYVQGGPNHDSGDNFTFHANSSAVVSYTLTGSVDAPEFSCTGCD